MKVVRQVRVPIEFEGEQFDEGFRADLIVEGKVILVPRSTATTRPDAKLTGLELGFLLNFGDELMKNGITRTINGQLDD